MKFKERFKRLFKQRFAILYPFFIYVVLFASFDHKSIKAGIGFVISGLFIRLWANGYAIKLAKLTTSGPYAFVRHPLYLGTLLLFIGFIIMLKVYFVGVLFLILFITVYYRKIKEEEQMLGNKFGQDYTSYKNNVPSICPTIFPYRSGEKWPFSVKRLINSQEYKISIWMGVLILAFYLKGEFLAKHEPMGMRLWIFIIFAVILIIADIVFELVKKYYKKQYNCVF